MENTLQVNNIYYNYVLLDPRKPKKWNYKNITFNYLPFYVGKGSKDRVKTHYFDSNTDNLYKHNKIQKLKLGGYAPTYTIFNKDTSEENAFKEEIELIAYIKSLFGNILTNIQDGGENPPVQFGKDNINATYVCLYDKDTGEFIAEWDSAADACRFLNIDTKMSKHITQCCKGVRRTAAMYKWSFEKKDKIEPDKKKFSRIKCNKIIAENNNEYHEFSSMKEAYIFLNRTNKGGINKAIKENKMYLGYNWRSE